MTFQIEELESIVAPGSGSVAYKIGYACGMAAKAVWYWVVGQ